MKYHYCAQFQVPGTTGLDMVDGIADFGRPIVDMDDYHALKVLIDPAHHKILTITALTPLPDVEVRSVLH